MKILLMLETLGCDDPTLVAREQHKKIKLKFRHKIRVFMSSLWVYCRYLGNREKIKTHMDGILKEAEAELAELLAEVTAKQHELSYELFKRQ